MNFYLASFLLAALLFFPVSNILWILSVRRLQRKLQEQLSPQKLQQQRIRARFISFFIVITFSLLFNYNLMSASYGG